MFGKNKPQSECQSQSERESDFSAPILILLSPVTRSSFLTSAHPGWLLPPSPTTPYSYSSSPTSFTFSSEQHLSRPQKSPKLSPPPPILLRLLLQTLLPLHQTDVYTTVYLHSSLCSILLLLLAHLLSFTSSSHKHLRLKLPPPSPAPAPALPSNPSSCPPDKCLHVMRKVIPQESRRVSVSSNVFI